MKEVLATQNQPLQCRSERTVKGGLITSLVWACRKYCFCRTPSKGACERNSLGPQSQPGFALNTINFYCLACCSMFAYMSEWSIQLSELPPKQKQNKTSPSKPAFSISIPEFAKPPPALCPDEIKPSTLSLIFQSFSPSRSPALC